MPFQSLLDFGVQGEGCESEGVLMRDDRLYGFVNVVERDRWMSGGRREERVKGGEQDKGVNEDIKRKGKKRPLGGSPLSHSRQE